MLTNNNERLNIWLGLADRCSYTEFVTACESANITTLSGMEFAQKIGVILAGMSAYPELPPSAAYLKYLNEYQTVTIGSVPPQQKTDIQTVTGASTCSSCGGGNIL